MLLGEVYKLDWSKITSSIPENDAPQWSASSTYNIGDQVLYEHRVYGSLLNGNTNNNPKINKIAWALKSSSNAFNAFDGVLSNVSKSQTTITYTIDDVSNLSAVAVFGIKGVWVKAEYIDGLGEKISEEVVTATAFDLSSFYNFCVKRPTQGKQNYIFKNIPARTSRLKITLSGENVEIAEITPISSLYNIGKAIMDTSSASEVLSYSVYDDNQFGVAQYKKLPSRVNSKFDVSTTIENFHLNWPTMSRIAGDIVVYEASEDRGSTRGIGILRSVNAPHNLPDNYKFYISFEGIQ